MKKKKQVVPPDLPSLIQLVLSRHSWTQKDLAEELGVRQPDISKMHYAPSWNRRYQILAKLIELSERKAAIHQWGGE